MARMKPGGVSTQDELNYTERREQVARLYLQGKTQAELATQFKVNQSTISRDLEAIRVQWQEQALLHFDEIKARELARIDRLEREYWDAWEESKKDAETIKQVGTLDSEKGKIKAGKAEKTSKGQSGNPSFLAGVQWCIEQRLKIFGVYEAIKVRNMTWKDDIVQALIDGRLKPEDVKAAYADSPDLVAEFFTLANVRNDAD